MLSVEELIARVCEYDKRNEWRYDSDYLDASRVVIINIFRRCIILLCMFLEKRNFPGLKVENKEDFLAYERTERFSEKTFYCTDDTYAGIFENFLKYKVILVLFY